MNQNQKIALVAGLILLAVAYVFPPWNSSWWPDQRYPLWSALGGWNIHWTALFAEWGLVVVATAVAIVLLHKPMSSLGFQQLPKG